MECLQRGTSESDDEARTFFEQALAVDPQYAWAQAGISLSHFNEWSSWAWDCWEQKEKLAYERAQRAAAQAHPALARHLGNSIKTGVFLFLHFG